MITAVLLLVAAAAGIVLNTRRWAGRLEAEYVSRYPEGADGVVAGAEGFTLDGTIGRRLLMLHGSGDSPQSLRYLDRKSTRLNSSHG